MKIGEIAVATATKVETVRFYEKVGLLPPPARTQGNYRSYGSSHLQRLSFIRRARQLGISLDDCWFSSEFDPYFSFEQTHRIWKSG